MENFKVLYRKYRPSNFDEIVGQENVVSILKNSIILNKISHAYIFTGPRGTGKTSTAKIFAKTINCDNPVDGLSCNNCKNCLNNSSSTDIIEIDAASNNGVDEIRELINNIKIAPSSSKYKVYIIDEVHMLSQSAFNALLLTLEEPPSHAIFILATTNIESVPITVLSRCQRFDFRKIPEEKIVKQLEIICKKENIKYDSEAIEEIAYLSDGGLRDALSILNQLSSNGDLISLESVLSNYGSISTLKIKQIADYYINSDYKSLKKIFDDLNNMIFDYKLFIKKLIDVLFERYIEFKERKNNNKYSQIKDTVFKLNDLINKVNININPFLLIFMILIENIEINAKSNEMTNVTFENSLDNQKVKVEEEKLNELIDDILEEETKANIKKNISNEKNLFEVNRKNEEDLEKKVKVCLNNCFVTANKQFLMNMKILWEDYKTNKCINNEYKNIILDSSLVMASENIVILSFEQDIMVHVFNQHSKEIEGDFNSLFNKNIKIIALSSDNWNDEKRKYLEKIKKGEKYNIIDEQILEKSDIIEDEISEKEEPENFDITSIFDDNKLEVK